MITISIPQAELFDETTNEYIYTKPTTISIEHSLVSISKWESKWEVPFLTTKMTNEQSLDYIRCMTITQNVDPNIYKAIPADSLKEINEYINSKQTATWFGENNQSHRKRIITSELIYFWMISCGIPFECQKWHLNRLITLIRVCQEENKTDHHKMTLEERRALNNARRKKFNTKG